MLILLAIPVILAVAFAHRLIQTVAPSNVLVRTVRSAPPGWRLATALIGLAVVLLLTLHVIADAILAGAPRWLNLVILVLAWDAIKVFCLGVSVVLRAAGHRRRRCHEGAYVRC